MWTKEKKLELAHLADLIERRERLVRTGQYMRAVSYGILGTFLTRPLPTKPQILMDSTIVLLVTAYLFTVYTSGSQDQEMKRLAAYFRKQAHTRE